MDVVQASDTRASDARARTSMRIRAVMREPVMREPRLVRESMCQSSGAEYLGDWSPIALFVHPLNEDCFESVLVGGAATRHRDDVAHSLWCQAIQDSLCIQSMS